MTKSSLAPDMLMSIDDATQVNDLLVEFLATIT